MIDDQTREGKAQFSIASLENGCYTYYKIFGDIQSTTPPLVVLHGGPGTGHEYCLPLSKLWSLYGIPVVFYDQIGCAQSTHLPHTVGDKSFWQVQLFAAELENLIDHLHLNRSDGPGFHLLGHSWGGIIAARYASSQPPGLRRLILASTSSDGQLFFDGILELKKHLSIDAQLAIDEAVLERDFTTPKYRTALTEFFSTFLCRAKPWPPKELEATFRHLTEDNTVQRTMQGASPWTYDGVLREYSSITLLPRINAPTLLINGEFDTTQYGPIVPFFNNIPRVRWVTLANASHMPFLDSVEMLKKFLKLVGDFLLQPELSAQSP